MAEVGKVSEDQIAYVNDEESPFRLGQVATTSSILLSLCHRLKKRSEVDAMRGQAWASCRPSPRQRAWQD